jgi:hypothetical protein
VFIISQGTFYIQDNKTKDIDSPLNEQKIKMFFQPFYGKFDLLTEVQWCINDRLDIIIQKMSKIIKSPTMQKMYQHSIFVEPYKVYEWEKDFNNNIKLFKHCYDKCETSAVNKVELTSILKFATEVENRINFNNAKYFVDNFCESNIRMNFQGGYGYRNGVQIENYSAFFTVMDTYNLNFNRLIEYISSDLYTQGITEFNNEIFYLYRDYLNMQIGMYGNVKEKYPKYLKTEHDIIGLKFSTYKKHKQDLVLFNFAKSHKVLEYQDKNYCIIVPQTSTDIVDEGINQSHCVASYVDRIANGETLIIFMRNTNEPDKSLVTVEVQKGVIKQAKGFANRIINEEETKFLLKWAKEKDLVFNLN